MLTNFALTNAVIWFFSSEDEASWEYWWHERWVLNQDAISLGIPSIFE